MKKIFLAIVIIWLIIWFYSSKDFWDISGWIALFMFGMIFLWKWFKELTWWWFEKILNKLTDKTWKSITLWAVWAAAMQSSSLVTIIAISFLTADLIPLAQGIAISLGSNIWTTSWAWIIASIWGKWVSISAFSMPIIVFWLLLFLQKSKNLKWIWSILFWMWIVFIWVSFIQTWFEELSKSIDLMKYDVAWFGWFLLFTAIWIALTLLLQSSLASILLIMAALWANQLSLDNAFALTIWANIWTTFTWILGSLHSNINWKRLAVADVISKTTTWIIFISLIYQIMPMINQLANILWFTENTFKIAIFHTVYNIVWVGILMPFYGKFIQFIEKIIPEKNIPTPDSPTVDKNIYLKWASTELPIVAIQTLLKETKHMYDNSIYVILKVFWLKNEDIEWTINYDSIKEKIKIFDWDIETVYKDKIKILFWEIMDFASRATWANEEKYYDDFTRIKRANFNIVETVKTLKHMQKNLIRYTNSINKEMVKHYEKIILDIIYTIQHTKDLDLVQKNEEKIKIIAKIEKYLEEHDIINNGGLDYLIRNKLISNEMATSLMKDTNYKNEICKNLIISSEMVFNKAIFDETQIEEKDKKHKKIKLNVLEKDDNLDKIISKFKRKKWNLKKKLAKEKDKAKKLNLNKEISEIEFILKKYK